MLERITGIRKKLNTSAMLITDINGKNTILLTSGHTDAHSHTHIKVIGNGTDYQLVNYCIN